MLQKAVIEYEDLAEMALFSGEEDFDVLKEAIKYFKNWCRVYSSIGSYQMHHEQRLEQPHKNENSVKFVEEKTRL